jgi:hypothetical protein
MMWRATEQESGLTRQEVAAAGAEVAALFIVFLVAFTGRDAFGDNVKTLLIAISVLVGGVGAATGLLTMRRGLAWRTGRAARLALGALMTFLGVYTIVHVLT